MPPSPSVHFPAPLLLLILPTQLLPGLTILVKEWGWKASTYFEKTLWGKRIHTVISGEGLNISQIL